MGADGDLDVIIRQVRSESSDIRSFVLEPVHGGLLPAFQPGAHIDVFPLPGLSRQYSLVGDPGDLRRYILGVKREQNGRGGSSAMHSNLQEGAQLRISNPKNNFGLRPNSGRNLLLAGGIGVTPLLCMAQALAHQNADFELHYFVRSNSEMAFGDMISKSSWSEHVSFHFGLVPPLLNDVLEDMLRDHGPDDLIYTCGPAPFMDVIQSCATAQGWPQGSVILEHFSAERPKLIPGEGEFVVRLAKRGIDLVVPSDKAIIDVLREAGIDVKTSCEQGVCGTCITPYLEGEVDHQDLFLSDDEREAGRLMTPCVSRASSKLLVLDM